HSPGEDERSGDEAERQQQFVQIVGRGTDQRDAEDVSALYWRAGGGAVRHILRRVHEVREALLHGRSTVSAGKRFRRECSRMFANVRSDERVSRSEETGTG